MLLIKLYTYYKRKCYMFNLWNLYDYTKPKNDMMRSKESMLELIREIRSNQTHLHFKAHLVEHVWQSTIQKVL